MSISGGAGARLVGLLGQLTQHLGSQSRFARAAGLLQQDMLRQRERMQQSNAARLEPAGLTLQQPEVLSSVNSLLTIMQQQADAPSPSSTRRSPPCARARRSSSSTTSTTPRCRRRRPPRPRRSPRSRRRARALGSTRYGLPCASAPPPPAPARRARARQGRAGEARCRRVALAALVSCGSTHAAPAVACLARVRAQPASCPICLEELDDAAGALQMPCARQHVFHKQCLLTFEGRNTCPICRHSMPVRGEAAPAAPPEAAAEAAVAPEQIESPTDEMSY